MTANPPATRPEFGPSPKAQAQVEELRDLEKLYPLPTRDEVMEDWKWLHAHLGTTLMEPYFEQLVAVCDGLLTRSVSEGKASPLADASG